MLNQEDETIVDEGSSPNKGDSDEDIMEAFYIQEKKRQYLENNFCPYGNCHLIYGSTAEVKGL